MELDFKNDITDGQEDASRPAPGAPTSTNYRSSRHIIEFNNMLFEYVSQRYADQPTIAGTYKDYLQALPGNIGNKPPGYVRLYTGNYGQLSSDPFIHRLLEEQGDLQGRESDKIDTLTF